MQIVVQIVAQIHQPLALANHLQPAMALAPMQTAQRYLFAFGPGFIRLKCDGDGVLSFLQGTATAGNNVNNSTLSGSSSVGGNSVSNNNNNISMRSL